MNFWSLQIFDNLILICLSDWSYLFLELIFLIKIIGITKLLDLYHGLIQLVLILSLVPFSTQQQLLLCLLQSSSFFHLLCHLLSVYSIIFKQGIQVSYKSLNKPKIVNKLNYPSLALSGLINYIKSHTY